MRLEHATEPSRKTDSNANQPSNREGENQPEFPSVNYFQVHFDYIEKLLGEAKLCLDALTLQVATFQQGSNMSSVNKMERRFYEHPLTKPSLSLQCNSKRRKRSHKILQPNTPAIETVTSKE